MAELTHKACIELISKTRTLACAAQNASFLLLQASTKTHMQHDILFDLLLRIEDNSFCTFEHLVWERK